MYDDAGFKNAYISFYLQMSDEARVTSRQVATLQTAFAQTGGFMTIVFLFTLMIVQRMQSTIYFSSLIKSFYKYQPELLPKDETDPIYLKVNDE
jgi:hypothetical protein